MGEAEDRRALKLLAKRLEGMGVAIEVLPGGRCARGRMPLRRAPFPLLTGPETFEQLTFATVGITHIKCLQPAPLFQLPMIRIAGCTTADMIEDRVRSAWAAHGRTLRDAGRALQRIGIETRVECGGSSLAFPLGLEDREAAARCLDTRRVALPARGPLTGLPLARAADRVWARPRADSVSDLEIATTNRLEALAREARRPRLATPAAARPGIEPPPRRTPVGSGHRLLLVGPLLGRDAELLTGLRGLGHRIRIEYSIQEALDAFLEQSYELVLADTHLGRGEGLELVPALSSLPGVERLPLVLVDERPRESVREAARRVGAAGYLAHPVAPARIAAGVERLLRGRGHRRFLRLGQRLAVDWDGGPGAFTTEVARLGLAVRTLRELPDGSVNRWSIRLAEIGETVRVDAQTIYHVPAAGLQDPMAGLRIRAFPDRNEALWIAYLTALLGEPKPDLE
ncbi:MAG: response regulator [Myxococcota bacterium]